MDIKKTLQNKFPQVNDAFMDKEFGQDFLRIEVALSSLDEVAKLSREISEFLDSNDPVSGEYFLDIYSAGTEQEIKWEDLESNVGKNVLVKLNTKVKDKMDFEGEILEVSNDTIIIKWNAKGQFRKQEILKGQVESINLSTKI